MHSCAVAQHLTTEPCLDDVFGGGQEGNYVLDCCTEIFRCLPQDSSESFLFNGMIVRHEMPNLYRILVMQNKLRVSYCNYSLIGKQGTRELLGSIMPHLCEPSSPAASRVLVHSGTPNSSGAVAISKTARTAAIRLLLTLIWLSVRLSRRRAKEIGSSCVGASVVHTPE